ncbi:hypothetical protein [Paracoccus marcusii]|uniref:hypothetical protein n=1 Tax=Paracoccus marcusii TaxID=59779 RepID=UPI001C3CF75A|nr:hypothetical protein [Paracoccus marcusii]
MMKVIDWVDWSIKKLMIMRGAYLNVFYLIWSHGFNDMPPTRSSWGAGGLNPDLTSLHPLSRPVLSGGVSRPRWPGLQRS